MAFPFFGKKRPVSEPSQPAAPGPRDSEPDDGLQGTTAIEVQEVGADETLAADIELAAVLYANGQDAAARAGLEAAVQRHRGGDAERLWLMLFDLYGLQGDHGAFEALGIEFAQTFEKSPPSWQPAGRHGASEGSGRAAVVLSNGLTASVTGLFAQLDRALVQSRVRLDCSGVVDCDAAASGRLLAWFREARRRGVEVELDDDRLAAVLAARLRVGERRDAECWLLYLELLQRLNQPAAFDEAAVNYAVTFEVSPPSWETPRPASAAPKAESGEEGSEPDAYRLAGEVRNARFADLVAWAETHDPLAVDLSGVARIDFLSAGALFNALAPLHRQGVRIILRHPNQLVAELLAVVGIGAVASVVPAKR